MTDPSIEVLGVYDLDVTEEIFLEQLPMYGDEQQCRDHFSSVVLIEAVARNLDDRFDVGDFGQPDPYHPEVSQCAYDEALLSPDGRAVIARHINCLQDRGSGPFRFAFYLHYHRNSIPLRWTYGEIQCPSRQPMPPRLRGLVPYRRCD